MTSVRISVASALLALLLPSPAESHSLSCRGLYDDRTVTIRFLRKSAEVSHTLFTEVLRHHYEAEALLERAVIAEIDRRPDPPLLREVLRELSATSAGLVALQTELEALLAIDRGGKRLPIFDEALARLLREPGGFSAVSLTGERYSNAGGGEEKVSVSKSPRTLADLLTLQRERAALVGRQLDETVESLRALLPLADRGEFVSMMLSGRSGFADKLQESIELLRRLANLYTTSCGTTVAAAAHVYPAGLEWLTQPGPPLASTSPAPPAAESERD